MREVRWGLGYMILEEKYLGLDEEVLERWAQLLKEVLQKWRGLFQRDEDVSRYGEVTSKEDVHAMVRIKNLLLVILAIAVVLTGSIASPSLSAYGADYPIIFLHGYQSEPDPSHGWQTWNSSQSAMMKIINEAYKGYTAGNPRDCHENTTLISTGGNTKKIYNFSYYHPDGSRGVIGSNGRFLPAEDSGVTYRQEYEASLNHGTEWAENLANFIYKVLNATGASKVNIVAHSMGGLVARATITYYGCANKVNKVITIGTPHDEFEESGFLEPAITYGLGGWMDWQVYGSLLEMGLDCNIFVGGVQFEDMNNPGSFATWCDWLGLNDPQPVAATIAGNRKMWWSDLFADNDGLVKVPKAHLNYAQFNPTIYASHSVGWADNELCLPTCTYTTEFIKKWIIDDEIIANATSTGLIGIYSTPFPGHDPFLNQVARNRTIRLSLGVDNFTKALVVLVGEVLDENYSALDPPLHPKAFPIYQYTKGFPGDPVYIFSFENYSCGTYRMPIWVYDMEGQISHTPNQFTILGDAAESAPILTLTSPNGSESWEAGTLHNVTWICNDKAVSQKLFLSTDDGSHWTEVVTLGGLDRSYNWRVPFITSTSTDCRVRIAFYLDVNTLIYDTSDNNFTITVPDWRPTNLQTKGFEEGAVKLTWDNYFSNQDGVEIWRKPDLEGNDIFGRVDEVPNSQDHYTDNYVNPGSAYSYKVRAWIGEWRSPFSSSASVAVPWLNTPTNPTADAISYHEITLQWEDHSRANAKWHIQYKEEGGSWQNLSEEPSDDIDEDDPTWNDGYDLDEYTVDGLTGYKKYIFRVYAKDDATPPHYSDYSNEAIEYAIPMWSNDEDALAFNNGTKIAVDPTNGTIGVVYKQGTGWAGWEGKIYYAESMDGGITWVNEMCISDPTQFCLGPAIAIAEDGTRCAIWPQRTYISEQDLYFNYTIDGNNWPAPIVIVDTSGLGFVDNPTVAVDNAGRIHISYTFTKGSLGSFPSRVSLRYLTFNLSDISSPDFLALPFVLLGDFEAHFFSSAIAVDNLGHPLIVWCGDSSSSNSADPFLRGIYYYYNDGSNWIPTPGSADELEGIEIGSSVWSPTLCVSPDGTFCAVWRKSDELHFSSYDGNSWSLIECVNGSVLVDSNAYPVIASPVGDIFVAFVSTDNEIYLTRRVSPNSWSELVNLTNSPNKRSAFPHIASSPDGDELYVIWTEGNDVPYEIKFKKVTLDETPPIVTVVGAPEDWVNEDAIADIHCEDEGGSGCDPDSYILMRSLPDACPPDYSVYVSAMESGEAWEPPMVVSQHSWICGAACDNARNCGFSSPVEFKVDKIPPDPPINLRSPSHVVCVWSSDNTIDMKWDEATDEGGSGVHGYEIGWTQRWPPQQWPPEEERVEQVKVGICSPPLDDGYWWFWIRTMDNADNRSTIVHRGPYYIDTTPPEAPTLISPPNGSFINDNTPFFDWSDVTDLSGVTYELRVWDLEETDLEDSEYQVAEALHDGAYHWRVRAVDKADNPSGWSATWIFTVDTVLPKIKLISPEPAERLEVGEQYTIEWEAEDNVGIDHIDIRFTPNYDMWPVEPFTTVPGSEFTYDWTVPRSPSDNAGIMVTAYDAAGNHGSDDVKFFICWLTSTDEEATALNNGGKLVRDSQGDLHLVFSSNYTVYYSMSVDEGESWIRKISLDLGRYPAISLDSEGSPCVVWATPAMAAPIAGSGIYFSRRIGGDQTRPHWTKPIKVLSAKAPSQPSFVIDESGKGHVVTVDTETTEIIYGMFSTGGLGLPPERVVLDKYAAYERASIAIDSQANTIHVVWDSKKGEIYYSTKEGGNWSPPEEISSETLGTSRSPFVDFHDRSVRVIWEQWEEKNWEIFSRAKWIDGKWGEVENVSATRGLSTSPQIVDGSVVVWQEQGKTDEQIQLAAEIYYRLWNGTGWIDAQNLSNTSQNSAYPQIALKKAGLEGILYCVWTEGGPLVTPSYRYEVKFGSAPVTLSRPRPRQPDLIVEDLKVSKESVQLQEEVGIEAKVTNQGHARAGRCMISFRVDGKEFDRRLVPELGPGMSTVISTSWRAAPPGEHTISAFVDVGNQVKESQEGNNERSRSIWVTALPDLTVIEFSLSNKTPEAGESVVVSALIANAGEVSTETRTEVIFQADGKEFYQEEIQPLTPGNKKEIRSRWIAEGGVHTIEVVVDPKDRIREENERNNRRSIQVEVKANRPPVANPDGPYRGHVGEPIRFDGSGSYDPDGRIVEYRWDFGDGYTAEGVSVTHTYRREGEYEVCLTVRDDDGATSTDCTRAYIEEKPLPDLIIHRLRAEPREPVEGQEVRIEALVLNKGAAAAKNALVFLLVDGRKFAESTIRYLPPNDERMLEFSWKAEEGWHTITVVADPYDEIEENNEENNKTEEKIQVKPKPKEQGFNFPNASRISFVGNSRT